MPFQQFLHQEMQREREGEEREQCGGEHHTARTEQHPFLPCIALQVDKKSQ